MAEPIGDAAQHHPLGQPGPSLSDHDQTRISLLGDRDEPRGGITELGEGLVLDTVERKTLFGLVQHLLLTFDQGG